MRRRRGFDFARVRLIEAVINAMAHKLYTRNDAIRDQFGELLAAGVNLREAGTD